MSGATAPLCSLGIYGGRVVGSVVGRPSEIAAVEQQLTLGQEGMTCLAIEGEPGIGKTRLLLAAEEAARARGFIPIAVTADEEIRGPLLLARSIFGSPSAHEAAAGTRAAQSLARIVEALRSNYDLGLDGLTPDLKISHGFDLAAVALRALAAEHPLAILIDDLQWADDDSLRMLRYTVRVNASSPIAFLFSVRSHEIAFVNEAVTLLADMDRMGVLRRVKLGRFTLLESAEFLQQSLGAPIHLNAAAIMHAQAEGVPFILAEQARAYRDAGMLQQIDGVWTLARNADRLLPSNVRTLIQRRSAHLPELTRAALAETAVLGRRFSLVDLQDVKARLGETSDAIALATALEPAVTAGLLTQHPDGATADYSFTHDQVREFAAGTLTAPRRRAIHAAVVGMLTAEGEPPAASLSLLADHALVAGMTELSARASLGAARAALRAHAPEEALRLVGIAHSVASSPKDRVALLGLQDDALGMLRRPNQRHEGLAELAALAGALGDTHLELDVMLRRAAAWRLSEDRDRAADLARSVRERAAALGDRQSELAACIELGQDLLCTELGEGYSMAPTQADLDGAQEAFQRAVAIAEELRDDSLLAAATRELGVIGISRVRAWVVARMDTGEHLEWQRRQLAGEQLGGILAGLPVAPLFGETATLLRRALEIYERLGDRRGIMSTIIAMAYLIWGPEIHFAGGARRIEEIRRLATRMKSLSNESVRAFADAQMLYGSHVYARAKVFPDIALEKGEEAYRAARSIGDMSLEFGVSGGMAMTYAELGEVPEAERWIGRAAGIAAAAPTPFRARQLESWRGVVCAAAGDAAGMREHFHRAIQLAAEHARAAARCEALAMLALEAARLGAERNDDGLLSLAEQTARKAKTLLPVLPGHPPWGAQADAALARVALARGALDAAAGAARAAIASLDAAKREDPFLDVLLPSAEALIAAGTADEAASTRARLRLLLGQFVQHVPDEDLRVRWFRGPLGRQLAALAGPLDVPAAGSASAPARLAEEEIRLLRLVSQGHTNREIADSVGTAEETVTRKLVELYEKIGVSSRADATAAALLGKLV